MRSRRSLEDHNSPGSLRFSALLALLVAGSPMTAHALVTTPPTQGALHWHDNEASQESWEWTSHNSNSNTNANSNSNSNSNSSSQSHNESHTTVITYSDSQTDYHSYQYSESSGHHHRDDPCNVS